MIRAKVAGGVVSTLLIFGVAASPASAQEDAATEDDDGFDDWGLLGLLGLAGLAGLGGKKRDDRDATPRSPGAASR